MSIRMCFVTVIFVAGLLLLLSPCTLSSTLSPATTTPAWPHTVPRKVSNLQKTYVGSTSVGLSWEAPANSTFTGYVVFASIHGICQYGIYILCPPWDTVYAQSCSTITVGTATCDEVVFFNVTSLLSYTDYLFTVYATNRNILSGNSTVKAMTQVGIPAPPSNVQGSSLNSSAILVDWTIPPHNAGPTTYIIRVLEAAHRTQSTSFKPIATYRVDGYNMTSCVVVNLLSSWRYQFDVASSTVAGNSSRITSATVTTLQSSPGGVQNLSVNYVTDHYMAVMVTWECPLEWERNGDITNYTVQYTGNISLTVTSDSYYPEDPCTDPHRVLLPVLPNVNYSITVVANAELTGTRESVAFYADLDNMMYVLPSTSNDTSPETDINLVITVSATGGSIIAVLLLMIAVLYFSGKRT